MADNHFIQLHFETVTPVLKKILGEIMYEPDFEPFYLVGGTLLCETCCSAKLLVSQLLCYCLRQ